MAWKGSVLTQSVKNLIAWKYEPGRFIPYQSIIQTPLTFIMPRPKGSKNKPIEIIENVDEKIVVVEAEIEQMNADMKVKKDELKALKKQDRG